MKTTGLSGNEMYCLAKKGYQAGNIVVGNSVHSLGMVRSIGTGFKAVLGGELQQITALIEEGRLTAYRRMESEASANNATGITGVSSELIYHPDYIEFLSIGSAITSLNENETSQFSTSADGQELYAQLDAGYKPVCFSFGNVAYSLGVARGFLGSLKTLVRGEVKEFSNIFNHTRHLALERIIAHARQNKADAVVGIKTTILPFGGVNEMLMIGTASHHPQFSNTTEVITSDLTNVEMWNLAKMGYAPMRLLLGTSVYSLGVIGSITSSIKTYFHGEINELSRMIYDARENAIGIINDEAKAIGADDVVGVKTYVYELGNGLIEFLAIGTAVKKIPEITTESEQLPPQAIIVDTDTFYNGGEFFSSVNINRGNKPIGRAIPVGTVLSLVSGLVLLGVFWMIVWPILRKLFNV